MKLIMSRTTPGTLLHLVSQVPEEVGRQDLVASENFLQVSSLNLLAGQKFASHRHIWKDLESAKSIAQESWVILKGRVAITYFDLDDSVLERVELSAGQISITLGGGHGYEILEDTIAYEFKSGPYLGREFDKVFIGDSKE